MGKLEQKVALYRAWDVLPESLKRSVAQPPPLLENLRAVVKVERDQVLADAWNVLANYVAGYVSVSFRIKTVIVPRPLAAHRVLRRVEIQNANFFDRRSWSMVKQSVDATFEDIRKRELLAELELRVIEVQCSALVMWITPSQRISQGFPMFINHDPNPTSPSSVIPANKDTSWNHQNLSLSLYVS